MRKTTLAVGCAVFLSCGGVAPEELPTGSSEAALHLQAVGLLGPRSAKPFFLEAASRERVQISSEAESAALDLERYSIELDDVCSGQQCPIIDAPCEVHWYPMWHGAPVPVCSCEYRGYLFPCR